MNANKTIQKLQMAILQQGLAVTVSRRQFFSTKTQHLVRTWTSLIFMERPFVMMVCIR